MTHPTRTLARTALQTFVFFTSIICTVPAGGYLLGISDRLLQTMAQRFGPAAPIRLQEWQRAERRFLQPHQREEQLLHGINGLVNRLPYADDRTVWGSEEYWATPAEFVSVNAGDCDDYVIAKYFTLRAHGVPAAKLRIVYVRALLQGRLGTHMVLAYYPEPNAEPLILDNIRHTILPVSRRPDLVPVYSFNDEHLYHERDTDKRKVSGVSMVRRWGELLERIKRENGT